MLSRVFESAVGGATASRATPPWPDDVLTAQELTDSAVASSFGPLVTADGWTLSTIENGAARLEAQEHSMLVRHVALKAPVRLSFHLDGRKLTLSVTVLKLISAASMWLIGTWMSLPDPVGRPTHSLWSLSRSTGHIVQVCIVYRSEAARDCCDEDGIIYTEVNRVEVAPPAPDGVGLYQGMATLVFNDVTSATRRSHGEDDVHGKTVLEVASKETFTSAAYPTAGSVVDWLRSSEYLLPGIANYSYVSSSSLGAVDCNVVSSV